MYQSSYFASITSAPNFRRIFKSVATQITRTLNNAKFEVLTVVLLKIQVFWNVTLCFGWVAPNVTEDCNAFIFRVKKPKNSPRRWRHHILFNRVNICKVEHQYVGSHRKWCQICLEHDIRWGIPCPLRHLRNCQYYEGQSVTMHVFWIFYFHL
jgi:hypothetical protein